MGMILCLTHKIAKRWVLMQRSCLVQVAKRVHRELRGRTLTKDDIATELDEFAALFAVRVFPDREGGANGAWGKAQIQYLRHAKARPRGPKQSARATHRAVDDSTAAAGGPELHRTIALQKRPVILNGLEAARASKQWAHLSGFRVSSGTIGTERLWRNRQRKTKNHSRSSAEPRTVNLLEMSRWLSEVQSRLLHMRGCVDLSKQPWLIAACFRFADALTPGAPLLTPLADRKDAEPVENFLEKDIGMIYSCYQSGSL